MNRGASIIKIDQLHDLLFCTFFFNKEPLTRPTPSFIRMNEGTGASPEAICLKKPVQSQQYLIKNNTLLTLNKFIMRVTFFNRLISCCEMFPTAF